MGTVSCWHGVTTAVMGNCGVTFAPCRPEDREVLAAMMESVEDIPAEAIMTGLPWDWETYSEYLDSYGRHAQRHQRRRHGRALLGAHRRHG